MRQSVSEVGDKLDVKAPKTDDVRGNVLAPFIVDALREHKREQNKTRMKTLRWRDHDLVCPDSHGRYQWPSNFTAAFSRFVKAQPNMPPVTFHGLRHSHASVLVALGTHMKVVQERLGHSAMQTTADRYSHVDLALQREAAARFNGVFAGL